MGVISNGTTLLDAGSLDSGVTTGAMTLIKTLTASSSGTLSFVDGASSVVLDDTYDSYVFKFINIHPSSDGALFQSNMSIDAGSNYNVTKTTTVFRARHAEGGGTADLAYRSGNDLAQATGKQTLTDNIGSDNDQSVSGFLHLFNPSSTTFVKHFLANTNTAYSDNYSINIYTAGYCNTTSAVDAIQFSMSSENIDSGVIKLYGIGG